MAKHDVTQTPFSQTFLDRFSEILLADVKSMLRKVRKAEEVSRRCLLPFLSYRENPAGGQNLPPPPAKRMLTAIVPSLLTILVYFASRLDRSYIVGYFAVTIRCEYAASISTLSQY